MSEAERRRYYTSERILIESARVLSPQFDLQGLYLSGAQVEMLRNVAGYLRRKETYVDGYESGYYIIPEDNDLDTILAIVADLEDKLMANDNVVWGFNDGFVRDFAHTTLFDGTVNINSDDVPEGEILELLGVSWTNTTGARGAMQFLVKRGSIALSLARNTSPGANVPLHWSGRIVLEEDDRIVVKQAGCLEGDTFVGSAWGVRMKIAD